MQISHSTIGITMDPSASTRALERNSLLGKSVLTTKNSSNRNNIQFHESHIKMAKLIASKNKLRETDMTGSPPPETGITRFSKMSSSIEDPSKLEDQKCQFPSLFTPQPFG